MLHWILLLAAWVCLLLGLLTVLKSPDWSFWKLAVLAGEYGHWLILLPLIVFVAAWPDDDRHLAFSVVTRTACVLAVALLLKPTRQAQRLGKTLSEKLEMAFGRVELSRPPFSYGALLNDVPAPVRRETMVFVDELKLDFYRAVRPGAKIGPAPCVLVIHGGGWDGGERDELAHFNHWLARCGYAVAAISYRLAPEHTWPAQRDDILLAIAFLKRHAAAFGIDATRLVLFGRSAGGNLAETTAYTVPDPAIRGVVAFYAPADLDFAYACGREDDVLKSPHLLRQFLGGPPETFRAAYDGASGYLHVGKTTPPTLLIHGKLDPLVWHRQSERLEKKLAAAGVPHAFVSFPWATHAFEYNLNGPGGQLATYAVEWFLAAVTR